MTYCLVMSGTPGPNNVMLTALGANFGYRRSLGPILGINAGVFAQTFCCCLGLGSLFIAYPQAHAVLRVTGVLYLIYLAWKLSGVSAAQGRPAEPLSFAQAVLFQALNPKSWIKAITLASVFMPTGLGAPQAALLVGLIGSAIGFPCNSMWALFGVAIRRFLAEPRQRRIFNLAMAATLLVLAASLLR
jgi:threonine/homoserine/homoserine lactone efflux protein